MLLLLVVVAVQRGGYHDAGPCGHRAEGRCHGCLEGRDEAVRNHANLELKMVDFCGFNQQ